MIESVRNLGQVAREWDINPEDVLLIALNVSDARSQGDVSHSDEVEKAT
jgi:hypothetical protein